MPESAPQIMGALHAVARAAVSPSAVSPVQTWASPRASHAAPSAPATPASLAHSGWIPPSVKSPASRRVHRGAVEPATGASAL